MLVKQFGKKKDESEISSDKPFVEENPGNPNPITPNEFDKIPDEEYAKTSVENIDPKESEPKDS